MKRTLLAITCFLAYIISIQAQTLYGTTFKGGNDGAGTIAKFIPATNSLIVAKSFESLDAAMPKYTNFLQASDGRLYGMTQQGGSSDSGAIFSYDPFSSAYTKLKDLNYTTGTLPAGSLVQASDGKLYGMMQQGGSSDAGVIFSFDPSSSIYAKLKDFDFTDGGYPLGSLIQASDGKLYGMTTSGGNDFSGVIFSFDLSSATYTKLMDFNYTNGAYPNGSLMQASNGKLYGMTSGGGSSEYGVIFSFDPSSSTYSTVQDFDGTNGAYPYGSLIQASDGKLYGMTSGGGSNSQGVIFSFDPSLSSYTKLEDFGSGVQGGAAPYGSLIQASDGKLYGMTNYSRGPLTYGIIFSFDPVTSTYAILKYFDNFLNIDGSYPFGSLIQATDGKLYGMTTNGGIGKSGVIFSYDPSASTYIKLKDFGNVSGSNVSASLLQAGDGKLYGMTNLGGSNGAGVIFSFDTSSSTYTKLKDFDIINGGNPLGSLIRARDGKLYGMTNRGGSSDDGVIFSFDPFSSTYTKLMDFNYDNGAYPNGSFMQASDGKLYGMTSRGGGPTPAGVIFSFDPSTSTYTKLMDFDYTHGGYPNGSLMQASNGKLYGMTSDGGSNFAGVIFSFDPSSSIYTNLKDFDNINGAYPNGSLMQAIDGKLYGMTSEGGSNGFGIIFSFDLSSSTFTKLKDFDNDGDGGHPEGSLMQASDGKLYGTTNRGGSSGYGTIFSFDPSSSIYTKLKDYDGTNGANPYIGSTFIEEHKCIADITYYRDEDSDGYGNLNSPVLACFQQVGYVTNNFDCDDTNAAINTPVTYYRDEDRDGYGDPNNSENACSQPAGYVPNNNDCNDNNSAINTFVIYYRDEDGDGYGNPNSSKRGCGQPTGYVANNSDCDDNFANGGADTLMCAGRETLYGTTYYGGNNGGGTINKFIPATNNLIVSKSFESSVGNPNEVNFIQASDGKLYGMTSVGGSGGNGVIFSFDPCSSTYTKLKDFDNINGARPTGSLMQASDGKLYGMTREGGTRGFGVIFSFDPSTLIYTKLVDFDDTNGTRPEGNLIQASDGKLYGMTGLLFGSGGHPKGYVVFFSFDPSSFTFTILKYIKGGGDAADNFHNNIIQGSDGKLYGMAGVIFSFDPSTSTYEELKVWNNVLNGGSLVEAIDGKLYGFTSNGGSSDLGTIFSFDPLASTYTELKDFDDINGAYPEGSLIQARDGKLFGMTPYGGNNYAGILFSFDPSSSTFTKLMDFGNGNGRYPNGSLLQASDGKLYGMTPYGGISDQGVIFSFDPSTSTYTKLKDFGTNEGGSYVSKNLIRASDGKLYGTTTYGGSFGAGIIFSFDPSASTYSKLKDFDYTNGANPLGSLMQASDGKLYGTTLYGGSSSTGVSTGFGVIFSFDPSSSIYTKLKDFDYTNGASADGSLMEASDGKLYGTTYYGGSGGHGVIFSFDPSASTYTILKEFDGTNGYPFGNLIQASDGKLYGSTPTNIFSYDPYSSTYTKLVDFADFYLGSLMQARDGKLYGTASYGGNSDDGVIFSFDPSSSTLTKLKDFDTTGSHPIGGLMQASDGKLYGTTYEGGSSNNGIIFSYDPSSSSYTKLTDYNGANGSNPLSTFIEVNKCIASTTYYHDADGDGYGNPDSMLNACTRPMGYVTDNTDCNDNDAAIHAPVTYYRDADRDHFGDAQNSISVCRNTPPAGYVKNNYDCDDHDRPKPAWDTRVLMCHNGNQECVKAKDIFKKLHKGWTLGPCSSSSCSPDQTVMCHNGKEECVKTKDVQEKLNKKEDHWTIGSCSPGIIASGTSIDAGNADIFNKEQSNPREFNLSSYPNPFVGTTTIKYELPYDSKVSIKVYDILGRDLATLVNENKKAGTYTIDFNAGHFSRGSLYYRMIATSKDKQFKQTNKMIQIQ